MPSLALHYVDAILSTLHADHLSSAVPTVVKGPFTRVTIVLVCDSHLGYEATLHILPRNDAGRVREIAGKTSQQCLAINVDVNVAISTRSSSIIWAISRHSLKVDVSAMSVATRDKPPFQDALHTVPVGGVPGQVKEAMVAVIDRRTQAQVQDSCYRLSLNGAYTSVVAAASRSII